MATLPSPTLGTILREIRATRGWSLKQMSARVEIPVSTLSKIEHDRLTLTYDRLQRVGQCLEIPVSRLFGEGRARRSAPKTGVRSIAKPAAVTPRRVMGREEFFLCTELREKRMAPTVIRLQPGEPEPGAMILGDEGEKFVYVVEGQAEVHCEFYAPLILAKGEGVYFDASMDHGFAAVPDCDEAMLLVISAR